MPGHQRVNLFALPDGLVIMFRHNLLTPTSWRWDIPFEYIAVDTFIMRWGIREVPDGEYSLGAQLTNTMRQEREGTRS